MGGRFFNARRKPNRGYPLPYIEPLYMLISHRYHFLFFHKNKNAGASVRKALAPYADKNYRPKREQPHRQHHAPARFIRESSQNQQVYDDYFVFAIARNPWDRYVSLYHFILQKPNHKQHKRVINETFTEFVHRRVEPSQYQWLCDPRTNTITLDYVGRYEYLHDDFKIIVNQIGIDAQLTHHIHKSRQRARDYRSYYDDETAELVAQYHQKDIEQFNYDFEKGIYT